MTFQELGIIINPEGSKQQKTKCPKCQDQRKNNPGDTPLSVEITTGNFKCHHCGWSGNIAKGGRKYTRPDTKEVQLKENTISWFGKRGISKETLELMNVSRSMEWMPQLKKETGCIEFRYYRDDVLVNIKYRDEYKNFKLYKDAELILYNLDGIKDSESAIICEGEIDCLSFIEAGITYVVSVPNGAVDSKYGNNNTSYLDTAIDGYLKGKDKIYIATDNDKAGRSLRRDLLRRLKNENCYLVEFPEGIKDANDLLVRDGKDALHELLARAKRPPVDGVIYAGNVWDEMEFEYENGKERGTTTYYPDVDKHWTWRRRELQLITGIPNMGKSNWIQGMMLIKSMREGDKWGVYTPESYPPKDFYDVLIHAYLGKHTDKKFELQPGRCTLEEYRKGYEFVREHFFFVYPKGMLHTPSQINDTFGELIVKEGVTGVMIDPFNQLHHDYGMLRDDIYLSSFLANEKTFANDNDIYKIIVAHPNKMTTTPEGEFKVPTAYDIHGGSMWYNKCDNIVVVHRPFFNTNKQDDTTEIHVQKIKKQELVGFPGFTKLRYSRRTQQYQQDSNGFNPYSIKEKEEELF